jgi:hypothetical protein
MAALKALLWDETVLHVEYRSEPTSGETCGVWVVGSEDYRRIITFVRASGVGWSPGAATLVAKGYGPRDAFYAATGEYTPIDTCNQWTGRALRLAIHDHRPGPRGGQVRRVLGTAQEREVALRRRVQRRHAGDHHAAVTFQGCTQVRGEDCGGGGGER